MYKKQQKTSKATAEQKELILNKIIRFLKIKFLKNL